MDLARIDQARLWMSYVAFSGDLERVAKAAKVPVSAIASIEHDFDWTAKLRKMKNGSGAEESEREANRAVSYMQAQRMRDLIEKSISLLEDPEALLRSLVKIKFLREGDVEEVVVSPKALLDLAKALESIHNACYRALGDVAARKADPVAEKTDKVTPVGLPDLRKILGALESMERVGPGLALDAIEAESAPVELQITENEVAPKITENELPPENNCAN
jgi:hypothetical protein